MGKLHIFRYLKEEGEFIFTSLGDVNLPKWGLLVNFGTEFAPSKGDSNMKMAQLRPLKVYSFMLWR